MDMCLTARRMDATEAERSGLVSRVVPVDGLKDEAIAFEGSLADGMMFERRLFHGLFATQDQKEGMAAFIEKRPATFTNR